TIASGAEIASTTAGTGAGGPVFVETPGTLVLNGAGVANTQITASAIGPRSGPGGSVTVAAEALTVEGGAQIASSTAGPGGGGDVKVTVASEVVLPAPGPQITARSTGSGDAGSITVSASAPLDEQRRFDLDRGPDRDRQWRQHYLAPARFSLFGQQRDL